MAVLTSQGGIAPPAMRRSGTSDFQRFMRRWFGEDWATGYLFAFPMLLLLGGLIAWPLLQAMWMSFFNVIGNRWGDFVGLRNYQIQIEDPLFRRSRLTQNSVGKGRLPVVNVRDYSYVANFHTTRII